SSGWSLQPASAASLRRSSQPTIFSHGPIVRKESHSQNDYSKTSRFLIKRITSVIYRSLLAGRRLGRAPLALAHQPNRPQAHMFLVFVPASANELLRWTPSLLVRRSISPGQNAG